MYCTKCGKQIDYDAEVCNECKAAETARNENDYNPFEEPPIGVPTDADNRMFGFGKALASTIIAVVNLIFSFIAMAVSLEEPDAGIVLILMGIAMFVVSLIFGIKSITTFKRRCRENCAKPIPTLILGIVGIVVSATAAMYLFVALCVVAVLI